MLVLMVLEAFGKAVALSMYSNQNSLRFDAIHCES